MNDATSFQASLDKSAGPQGCWPWTGNRSFYGYGRTYLNGKRVYSHRVALEIALGRPIKTGLCVCHHCDNPPCCNPAHLFEATQAENLRDMMRKGRHVSRGLNGEEYGRLKLTVTDVLEIREAYAHGETQVSLARRFPCFRPAIGKIVLRQSWRHV